MSYSTISHCGNDHSTWIKNLDFYKDDLKVSEKRLGEVAGKNTNHDMLAQVEHFQNQFIVQRNNIDELKHRISQHDKRVSSEAQSHAGKIEQLSVKEHEAISEETKGFEVNMNDLRYQFNEFLSKWM